MSAKTLTTTSLKPVVSAASKKTYYVRVRTVKTVGKTNYYSGWSSVKKNKSEIVKEMKGAVGIFRRPNFISEEGRF